MKLQKSRVGEGTLDFNRGKAVLTAEGAKDAEEKL
jgi:hypothetical protein